MNLTQLKHELRIKKAHAETMQNLVDNPPEILKSDFDDATYKIEFIKSLALNKKILHSGQYYTVKSIDVNRTNYCITVVEDANKKICGYTDELLTINFQ